MAGAWVVKTPASNRTARPSLAAPAAGHAIQGVTSTRLPALSSNLSWFVQVLEATGTQGIYNSAVSQQNSVINFAHTAQRIRNEFFR